MSLNIPSTKPDQSASSVVQAAQQLSTAVTDQNLRSVQKPAIPMYLLNADSWSDAGRMKTCDRYSPNLLDLCILCYATLIQYFSERSEILQILLIYKA